MKSAETHPTPQRVVDACHVIAAWLREIGAAEAVVAPTGGASFHDRRMADEYLNGWGAARAVIAEAHRILMETYIEDEATPLHEALLPLLREGLE